VLKERINQSPRTYSALLGLLLAFIGVVKYGIDVWPGWLNMFALTQNLSDPHASPFLADNQDYILNSPTAALLLGAIPGSGQFVFVAGNVLLTFIALLLPFAAPRIAQSKEKAHILFIFMAGGALLPLLLTWIASYDPMTIIGLTLALGFRQPLISMSGWALTCFNHSTLGIISFAAVTVVMLATSTEILNQHRSKLIFTGTLGLAVGYILNAALIGYWGGATSRWELFREYPFDYYLNNSIASMPTLLFSAFGVGWLVLLRPQWLKLSATKVLIALGILVQIAASMTALDQTRVSVLVLFAPLYFFVCTATNSITHKEVRKTWRALLAAAIIVPIPIFWVGVLEQNSWQSILHWTANFL